MASKITASPEDVLAMLRPRRGDLMCGCGRELEPLMRDGKQIGVVHKTYEDEDWHNQFFGGMAIREA